VASSPRSISEVGESLKGDDMDGTWDGENREVRDDSYSEVVLSAKGLALTLGSPLRVMREDLWIC
jgi:hypothetical protein